MKAWQRNHGNGHSVVRGKVLCGAWVREREQNSYRHLEEPKTERKRDRLDTVRVIC